MTNAAGLCGFDVSPTCLPEYLGLPPTAPCDNDDDAGIPEEYRVEATSEGEICSGAAGEIGGRGRRGDHGLNIIFK